MLTALPHPMAGTAPRQGLPWAPSSSSGNGVPRGNIQPPWSGGWLVGAPALVWPRRDHRGICGLHHWSLTETEERGGASSDQHLGFGEFLPLEPEAVPTSSCAPLHSQVSGTGWWGNSGSQRRSFAPGAGPHMPGCKNWALPPPAADQGSWSHLTRKSV